MSKHSTRLAAELAGHRIEVGALNHRAAGGSAARRRRRRWRGCRRAVRTVGDGVPQRGVPGVVGGCSRRRRPGLGGQRRVRGKLNLIRDLPRHHEPEALAGLRRNVGGVGELDPSAARDRRSDGATRLRRRPAASSRCAARNRCGPGLRWSASARRRRPPGSPPAAQSDRVADRTAARPIRRSPV